MPAPRNEQKYQMIKLVQSGRAITEARALMKAASTGLDPEYTSAKDLKDLAKLEGIQSPFADKETGDQANGPPLPSPSCLLINQGRGYREVCFGLPWPASP